MSSTSPGYWIPQRTADLSFEEGTFRRPVRLQVKPYVTRTGAEGLCWRLNQEPYRRETP